MKKFGGIALKLSIVFVILMGGLLTYLRFKTLPVITVEQTSQMYDVNGEVIDTIYQGENRQVIPLSQISPHLIQATLSIEDQRFYEHSGLDFRSIARAMVVNLEHMSMVQGAGTITQQLARNLYLTHERTWTRKIKESLYALQMELQLSKDEILEQYLNQIYYGHSTYGAEKASQLFFGKHAKDLTLAESALLAGVPKGPRYYSPYYDAVKAKERQITVLSTMVHTGSITQEQADAAAKEPLNYKPLEGKKPARAPYFRDYVRAQAVEKLAISEDVLEQVGIRIYTTLDLKAQTVAEETIRKTLKSSGELQAALVAIDPRTGQIKAMVGGKEYKDNQFNRAVSGMRQPGSSFKPILYLAALQNGYTPLTKFKSEPTVFTYDEGRQTYMPGNYNNVYENDMIDMRKAIAKSDNIYAVHTIMGIGPEKVIDTAHKLGLNSQMKPLPSLALGTFPVSPMELAGAFATIANGGMREEATAILRIEDSAGNILYQAQPKAEKVVDPPATYVLTHLMESVFEDGGTGSRVAATIKRPIAGKTGTTDADSWMVGYTPELATAVWVGYDKGRNITTAEAHLSAPIFADFTEGALAAVPPKLFPAPDGVVTVPIDSVSGKLANDDCRGTARLESFVVGTEPTTYCSERGATGSDKDKDKSKPNGSWWEKFKNWLK
ncbi:PBP1A family penicillin-binding protein [Paenibacillus sp. N1-5-1-14]|uniref:transglycosylase domain-containing protein n=1 Tax=Paenibacillus radicibacter TaxID=2972488 RepID=UPI00215910A2|nr:PBP1A family penicillin-binding protein [Paenibacillus radicibacter]MCR8642573.1 PBP1A family penicillin-binding protein [Paenibacillus radicibacter]